MQTVSPLEKARAESGFTLDELTAASGISRYTIWRAEKQGVVPGRYSTRLKIARALGLEPEDLWPEDEATG